MARLEEDDHPNRQDRSCASDKKWDEEFVRSAYPLDPMMLAYPLIEAQNITIDPQLASQLQEAYEDLANRYLDLSAVLRTYVAGERRKAELERRRTVGDCGTPPVKGSGGS